MPKISFDWNLPCEMDPDEPACCVEFWFTDGDRGPGNGNDPDYDPAVVEDIHVFCDDDEWVDDDMDPAWYASFEEACWDHLDELSRRDDEEDGD